ncbi:MULTISPECIES: DUF421 domain-containing protein [Cupriavidus]|uniref:DUF421 domain-containing protein n=1 Tax=Cupriavidus pauculus TaxID=82633 RepID=A0A3G8H6E4_9BURK|nr:YetF domain-containing protein [Cupriavidus pauculus]AZG16034.1 DUF421 domain-containing protein [Cupriavidus pauculus]
MDLSVDWGNLLHFSISPLETMLRGTLMYWFLFLMFRFVARRDVGSLGIADLLIVVIVADAAQNGMAGKGDSVADAALLVGTLVAWNRLFDLGAWLSPAIRRFVTPQKVVLVRNGKKVVRNMERHTITDEELAAQLREKGVESYRHVKVMYLEPDGKISVITDD